MTPQPLTHHGNFKRHLQGWGLSLALHVTAVGVGVSLMTGLQAPPLPEPFQWNVSLVQPPPEPVHHIMSDASREVARQAEAAAPVQESVERQQTVALERQEASLVESLAPVPSPMPRAEARPLPAPVLPEPSPVPERKPVEEPPAVATAHQDAPSSHPPTPAPKSPPAAAETARAMPAQEAPPRPVSPEPASTQQAPDGPLQASVQPERPLPPPAQVAPPQPSSPDPASKQQAPASPAPASPSPAPATQKRDYGWLAEALWGRIEQLKRYPAVARLNHWEGKVVVRAVIKDDGNLADLKVAQSSGYEVLDQDALAILKQTAPLKLTQPLGRPQVVIHVPISYQLK